jgi:hypothetical protein
VHYGSSTTTEVHYLKVIDHVTHSGHAAAGTQHIAQIEVGRHQSGQSHDAVIGSHIDVLDVDIPFAGQCHLDSLGHRRIGPSLIVGPGVSRRTRNRSQCDRQHHGSAHNAKRRSSHQQPPQSPDSIRAAPEPTTPGLGGKASKKFSQRPFRA